MKFFVETLKGWVKFIQECTRLYGKEFVPNPMTTYVDTL